MWMSLLKENLNENFSKEYFQKAPFRMFLMQGIRRTQRNLNIKSIAPENKM